MASVETEAGGERLHGLDAVRGFALIGGVMLHAAMSFFPGPQMWIVKDSDESLSLAVLFYVLHTFRMPLFFLLAGFFGRMLFECRGLAGFVRDRLGRIGAPLLMFWPIVFPAIVACLIWAVVQASGGRPPAPGPQPNPFTVEAFPLTHLWFLYLLLLFYPAALMLRGLTGWAGPLADRFCGFIVKGWIPIAPALVTAAALSVGNHWPLWFGVHTPDTGLIPNPQALTVFGLAFTVGWVLHRQSDLLEVLRRRWLFSLLLAVAATALCLAVIGAQPTTDAPSPLELSWAYALGYGLAMWSWTFGLIGAGLALFSGRSPVRRYLADASYWIYLVHLPLVMALQVIVAPLGWPWPVKYAAILAAAFAVMLASYQLLVRHSFIGRMLNGRRPRRPQARPEAPGLGAGTESARS
ncbi:MAG: acyltransferase family protein [Caulobacteraceae bacterium]|nr:acyltransferase family protein [Caulobacteraceae bacterium]